MQLASNLDLAAAAPLLAELTAARRQPIELDASDVERVGGLCLQVLLAAQRQWRADGVAFTVVNASEAFAEALMLSDAGVLAETAA